MRGWLIPQVLTALALAGPVAAQDYTPIDTGAPAETCNGFDRYYDRAEPFTAKALALVGFGASKGYGKDVAVVVGIHEFDDPDFAPLPSRDDPIKVKDFLLNRAGFDRVYLLTGRCVTKDRLEEIMEDELPRFLSDDDRFVFYWQGHGDTRTTASGYRLGHLPLAESDADRPSSMVEMDDLADWDRGLPAFQTLYLLDSCFAGLAGQTYQSGADTTATLQLVQRPGRHLLVAGDDTQQTYVINTEGTSVFTKALLHALDPLPDDPSAADGIIRLSELVVAVQDKVVQDAYLRDLGGKLTPQVSTLRLPPNHQNKGRGEFFFFTTGTLAATDPVVYAKVQAGDGIQMMSRSPAAPPPDDLALDTPDPLPPAPDPLPPTTTTGTILALQSELARHNCRPGPIDGRFTNLTTRAMRLYNQVTPRTCGRLKDMVPPGPDGAAPEGWTLNAVLNLTLLRRCDAPACGTPPEPNFIRDMAQGCWYLAGHGRVHDDEWAIWTGACDADGRITGEGTLTFLFGSPPASNVWASYTGTTRAGYLEGTGTLTYIDGRRITGQFTRSRRID